MSARITLLQVLSEVVRHWNVPLPALLGRTRNAPATEARSVAMWLALGLTELSVEAIGRAMNSKPTAVARAVSAVQERLGQDAAFNELVHAMERRLRDAAEREAALRRRAAS